MSQTPKARPLAEMMSATTGKPSDVLADQLPALRRSRGWSQRELVEQLDVRFGVLVDPATVARIEAGQRGVSLDEMFLLAAVLDVPPLVLVLPIECGAHVSVAPGREVHPYDAWQWVTGRGDGGVATGVGAGRFRWHQRHRLEPYERIATARDLVERRSGAVRAAEYVGDEDAVRNARAAHVAALEELVAAVRTARENGVEPPALPAGWLDDARDAGIDDEDLDDVFTADDGEEG